MKIAFKNFLMTLKRYKVASLLNVLGLTLAFVAFYVIASQVWFTITYNGSFPNADRTYLISPDFGGGNDGEVKWSTNSPGHLAYTAAEQFPDAEEVASTMPYPRISRIWIKRNDYTMDSFNEYVYQGTANVPTFFGFECLAGDFSQLKEPNTVAMARSKSEKLGVGVGDVGFGLVVIVVRDKILHHIVGEEFPEFAAQLGGQGLVVGQHQGGAVDFFDDGGHGKGFAGAGHAQQALLPQPPVDAVYKPFNGLGLVAGGLIV